MAEDLAVQHGLLRDYQRDPVRSLALCGQNFELNKSSGVQQEKYTIGEALKDKFNWVFPFTYSGLLTFYIVLQHLPDQRNHRYRIEDTEQDDAEDQVVVG